MVETLEVSALTLPIANGKIYELQLRHIAKVSNGKDRLKNRLQTAVVTLARQLVHLQKAIIGALLYFNQIRDLNACRNFRKVETIAEATGIIRHQLLLSWLGSATKDQVS